MAQYDINLREYWRILKKRRILVILTTIILGIFSTFFAILRAPTPLYSSVSSIKFERQTPVDGLYARTISWSDSDDDMATQMSIIKSYMVFQGVAERLRLIPSQGMTEDSPLQSKVIPIIENLQSKVEVTRENFAYILNIKVTDTNPVFAQRLANTIALTYKEWHAEQQMKRTTEALKYIDEQLKRMRQNLRESEDEFNRFSQDNQLISIDMQTEDLLSSIREINNEIRKLREDKKELKAMLQRLNQFIDNPMGSDYDFYTPKASNRYETTNDTLMELLLKRDTLLEDYTLQHPEVVAISRKIIESARKMLILLKLQISGTANDESDLRKELGKVDRKTQVLMDKKLEFNRLKRKVELQNDMTALLEKKNQEALIRKAEKPEEVTILKPALHPTTPINPPRTASTGAMGIVIGMVLGLVIAFIVETFDTSLGAIEDVEETLGTQVLGVIPQADERDILDVLKGKYPEGMHEASEKQRAYLRSHYTPKSMVAESFRALRTNIQFKDSEKQIKSIAITSTSPQEGKTIVAINLAITMAQAGMKILLVGSDLRKPMISKVFGIETAPGLAEVLMGDYPWQDTVKGITDIILGKMTLDEVMMTPGMDNLHIITSGPVPSNPAELIDSSRLMDFMEEAKEEYDLVIFDSPPILSAADAAILGTKVDGVLLVYRLGTVSRGLLKRSTSQLEQINCRIMGVILNGMRPDVSPDFHDYKYYRYYYSYGEEDKVRRGSGHKKRFSFGRKKEDNSLSPDGDVLPPGVGKDAQEKQGKKLGLLRLSLMGVALAVLALGILWHNGVMDPFKLFNMERSVTANGIKTYVKKGLSNMRIQRKSKSISGKPKITVPKRKSDLEIKTPIPPSLMEARDWAEIDTPASPIEMLPDTTAATGLKAKPPIARSPLVTEAWAEIDTPASPVKRLSDTAGAPVLEVKTPIPPSPLEAKDWAKIDTPASPVKMSPDTTAAPELESKTPIPPSPLVTEAWADVDTPASPSRIQSYPYSLQVGAFRTLDRAEKAISMYSRKGLSAYRIKVELNKKGVWYRVFMGHFEDREQAERFKQEHGLKKSKVKKAPSFPAMAKGWTGMGTSVSPVKILSYSPEDPKLEAETPNPPSPLVAKGWAEIDTPASSVRILLDSKGVPGFEAKTAIPPSPLEARDCAEIDTPTSSTRIFSDFAETPRPEEQVSVRLVRKKISKKSIPRNLEVRSKKPRATISKKRPPLDVETSAGPSPLVAKAWAKIDTPTSPPKILSYPYSIQLGAFRTPERAEKAIAMYSKKGLSGYRVKVASKGKGIWYRVFTGHFEDREAAEIFKEIHGLKESVVKKTRYANLIGIHAYGDELETQFIILINLGYSPYIIKHHQGDSRLFVGAFSKKADAERQCSQLKLNGIHSEVVHR